MRARNVRLTLLLLVCVFLFAIYKKRQEPQAREAFNRTPAHLRFYAFARCRMACLHITEADINYLMQQGVINMNKSNRYSQPCPVFAVQARVRNQYLRVVFEQCRNATYVVTCYNLQHDAACDCPTDYKPNPS